MGLDYYTGLQLINKAFEEQMTDRLYTRWIQGYDREMSFEDFIGNAKQLKYNKDLTKEEIIEDVENILTQFRGGGS